MPSNPDFPHSSGQRGKGRAASSVGVQIGKVLRGIRCFAVKGWDKNSAIKEQKRMGKELKIWKGKIWEGCEKEVLVYWA